MKKFITLILILCLFASLAACSKEEKVDKNAPHGRYELFLLDKVSGILVFSGNKVTNTNGKGETTTGTFTMIGDEVVITYDNGETTDYTYDKEKDILYHIYGGLVYTKEYGKYYEWE